MNNWLLFFLFLFLFFGCTEKNGANKKENSLPKQEVVQIVNEEIYPYFLSATDTVYCVNFKLTATDSAQINYVARLMQHTQIFTDSIAVVLKPQEKVRAQIIFAKARVSPTAKPTFTSKLQIIESNN